MYIKLRFYHGFQAVRTCDLSSLLHKMPKKLCNNPARTEIELKPKLQEVWDSKQ